MIVGGILLLIGLLGAFLSEHYTAQIQGRRRMGAIVFGPTEGSPEWKKTEIVLTWADRSFYASLVLTAMGGILQTWASFSLLPRNKVVENHNARSRTEEVETAPSSETAPPPAEAGEGQNTPLRQPVIPMEKEDEAFRQRIGVLHKPAKGGPQVRSLEASELTVLVLDELNKNVKTLSSAIDSLKEQWKESSVSQSAHARALNRLTLALVIVTLIYVVIEALRLLREWWFM